MDTVDYRYAENIDGISEVPERLPVILEEDIDADKFSLDQALHGSESRSKKRRRLSFTSLIIDLALAVCRRLPSVKA